MDRVRRHIIDKHAILLIYIAAVVTTVLVLQIVQALR